MCVCVCVCVSPWSYLSPSLHLFPPLTPSSSLWALISPCLQVAVLLHFLVEPFVNATMEDVQLFKLEEQGETQEGYSILVHCPK